MNGFIQERLLKSGKDSSGKTRANLKVYDVRHKYKDGAGKWKTVSKKGFRRKAEAEAYLVEIQHQIGNNRYIPNKKILLREVLDEFFTTHVEPNLRPNIIDGYRTNITHIKKEIGDVPIQELTATHIQNFYNSLHDKYKLNQKGGLSPKSILYIHRVLSKAIDTAVRNQIIPRNVTKDASRPKVQKFESDIYVAEELKTLLKLVYDTDWEVIIMLGGLCGMRRGEILGLQYSNINFKNKTIAIRKNLTYSSKGIELTNSPKTECSRRTIPISDVVVKALYRLIARQEKYKLAFGEKYNYNDMVNCNQDGSFYTPNKLSKDFNSLLKALNLKPIRFHDLRHSCASLMLSQNVPLKVTSEILGHSTVGITADLYSHCILESKVKATNKISDAIFKNLDEDNND